MEINKHDSVLIDIGFGPIAKGEVIEVAAGPGGKFFLVRQFHQGLLSDKGSYSTETWVREHHVVHVFAKK